MGMTIDQELAEISDLALKIKTNYLARLKDEKIAMLEDLDLQIDEIAAYNLEVAKVQRLIRDKIDKLKGEENGKIG